MATSKSTRAADVTPEDNGYLSEEHAEKYNSLKNAKNRLKEYPGLKRNPLRAKGSQDDAADWKPVTQKWYADQGIITPEMEYIAIRENLGRTEEFKTIADNYPNLKDLPPEASDRIRQLCTTPDGYEMPRPSEINPDQAGAAKSHGAPASGQDLGRDDSGIYYGRVRAIRSGQRPGDHSAEHQPSRMRADDHWAELPGEDQRQHRKLGGHFHHR